jgi:hypothetical protein
MSILSHVVWGTMGNNYRLLSPRLTLNTPLAADDDTPDRVDSSRESDRTLFAVILALSYTPMWAVIYLAWLPQLIFWPFVTPLLFYSSPLHNGEMAPSSSQSILKTSTKISLCCTCNLVRQAIVHHAS